MASILFEGITAECPKTVSRIDEIIKRAKLGQRFDPVYLHQIEINESNSRNGI